uniref:tripartite motif-containing protein 60-like n=1 Tax=Jaculus jaculus TaxID=51337 RepID=UPI001E1B3628|nr:tripartite motif-containing protein 60-like [Jaculus jaculus]
MEFETALESLQEECGCPLCLNYLKDPVTISCGHNFCYACLSRSWKGLKGAFPCPVCQVCFSQRKFRRNRQLRNLAEIARSLKIRGSKRKSPKVCEKHQQILTHFCMKDQQVLCSRCSVSVKHQRHHICRIKKVAPYHRKILESSIEPLKNNVERVERIIVLQSSKLLELGRMAEQRKEAIYCEFEQVRQFLQDEWEARLREMEVEGLGILSKLSESFASLSDHASTLKHLLGELRDKGLRSNAVLLTRAQSIYHRHRNLRRPEVFSFRLKEYGFSLPPLYSGLDRVIERFQTDVHFDFDTAHVQLVVSKDRKIVHFTTDKQHISDSPQRFTFCPSILGFEKFVSGRHYWEVEVGSKHEWTVGVCEDSFPRTWQNHPSPVEGLWAIGLYSRTEHVAFGPMRMQGMPAAWPSKIGIFLDYELGEVSFYDRNNNSLIYRFNDGFSNAICPYFDTGLNSVPLKILPIPDHEGI